jgi:hypothetical protein
MLSIDAKGPVKCNNQKETCLPFTAWRTLDDYCQIPKRTEFILPKG